MLFSKPRMLTFSVLLLLRFFDVSASILSSPRSTASYIRNQNDNLETLCNLTPSQDVSFLTPWKEVPQRAQGCSVPFYGPQGHGQFPEEVHIVHVMEVDKLIQTISHKQQALATITIQLDSAFCENTTVQAAVRDDGSLRNDSDTALDESRTKLKNIPMILKLQDMSSDDAKDRKPIVSSMRQGPTLLSSNSREKRPLILLLLSDQPVMWQLKPGVCWSQELASKVQAVVERDSSVDSDIAVEVIPKSWVKKINRKNIQRYARRTYHGVASFTQIRASNFIRIIVGPRESPDNEKGRQFSFRNRNKLNFCDFGSREDSLVVSATLSIPLLSEGCFLGESKEASVMHVLIIDVIAAVQKDESISNVSKSANSSKVDFPQISVHLSENKSSKIDSNVKSDIAGQTSSNVIVVLRSQPHTQWILSSSIQHSSIHLLVDEGDSVDCINSAGKAVNISYEPLPESRSDLLQTLHNNFATPVRYFKIDQATGFGLVVNNIIHPNQGVNQHHQSSGKVSGAVAQEPAVNFDDAENEKHTLKVVESEMVLTCGSSVFEIVLPAPILTRLGVKTLHLRDRSCQSHSNGTHFVLTSLLGSCGSEIQTNGKTSAISNSVYVNITAPGRVGMNVAGLIRSTNPAVEQARVPVSCVLKPSFDDDDMRSIFMSRGGIASEEDEDSGLMKTPSVSAGSSIYQLELYHRDAGSGAFTPVKYRNIIDVEDRIYVRAWMDDAPSAQAVIESCWISNLPQSSMWLPNQKRVLLRGMCPVEKGVRLEKQPSQAKAFVFSFQLMEDFYRLGQELYVHCQIGVCLSTSKHMKIKPILCVDPQDYCLHLNLISASGVVISTAHQLLTRGPLFVPSSVQHAFTPDLPPDTKCKGASIFPYSSNISMDMTIAIATCSFIIGMGLTATLWYIHNKTEPTRRPYHGREHSLGSQSAVLGSSLSPHSACSSTNSQSIITS